MNSSDYVDTKPLEEMVYKIGVDKVFGAPVKEGDVTLIPVAQVMFGFGYGGGSEGANGNGAGLDLEIEGVDDEAAQESDGEAGGEAGGGGAGAGGRATPRGFIRIEDGRASYSAIEDDHWIPLAGILMVAWGIFWVTATIRFIAKQVAQTRQMKA